jgi:hypothetical protein
MTTIAASLIAEPLWTRARAMFARAVAALGGASSIALLEALPRTLRRQIVAWLYPLECIVRRLLVAEAAALHRAECPRAQCVPRVVTVQLRSLGLASQNWSARPPAAQNTNHRVDGADAPPEAARSNLEHPESWRASFSFALPRNPHLVSNARAPRILDPWRDYPPPPPPRAPRILKPEDAPFRLARRFEALRRVIANPRPYAERLVRLLVREARRVPRLVMRYMLSGPRTDDFDPADSRLSLDALGAAYDAPEAFKDTS